MKQISFPIKWVDFFATGFYVGRIPKAPGTFGTLVGVLLYWLLSTYFHPMATMGLSVLFIFFSIAICHLYEAHHGGHDTQEIVIDEIAGYLVAAMWLPQNFAALFAAFVLFRFFDILKPPPIRQIDAKVEGGLGVVADDLAAGLVTNIILQVVFRSI